MTDVPHPTTSSRPSSVLVVDDAPANLLALSRMLRPQGHRVQGVTRGAAALELARRSRPDLILLDIAMPGMDGFEVCAALKADPQLAEIPVIFISALGDVHDKVRGLELGAVDYITKPFNLGEVRARVAVQLERARHARALSRRLTRIKELEEVRDQLVHMVVHDLRGPIAVATTFMAALEEELAESMDEDQLEDWSCMKDAMARLGTMVSAILDAHQLENAEVVLQSATTDLVGLAGGVVRDLTLRASTMDRDLVLATNEGSAAVVCDPSLIERVLVNLVDNALKYSPSRSRVTVTVTPDEDGVRLEVHDQGSGIAAADQPALFDRFARSEPDRTDRRGLGLGLAFCRLAVEAHGGTIGIDSLDPGGTTFWFWLPNVAKPTDVRRPAATDSGDHDALHGDELR